MALGWSHQWAQEMPLVCSRMLLAFLGFHPGPDICGAFNGLNSLVGFQGHPFRKTSKALIVGWVLRTWDLSGVFSTPSTTPFLRSH